MLFRGAEEDVSEGSPAPASRDKLLCILEAALERGALDPLMLDIRGIASFADTFVLLTGRSDRQARAIADSIVDALQECGDAPLGVEGLREGHWILIDCNDAIVHVFEPEKRDLYSLERLWSDAPVLDLIELGVSESALEAARSGEAAASDRAPGKRRESFL
jgi:ribosome-associated protein